MTMISDLRAADFALALRDAKVLSDDATYVMGSLRDVHHAALKALRTPPPPSGEAGEVAYWHNGMGQVMTPAQKADQDEVCASRFSEPLYALPTIKEPTDGK
jgi:hypothetical protein